MRHLPNIEPHLIRQLLLGLGMAGFIAAFSAACAPEGGSDGVTSAPSPSAEGDLHAGPTTPAVPAQTPTMQPARPRQGELGARPGSGLPNPQPTSSVQTGVQPLGISSGRDGLIYVPAGYSGDKPAALVVLLHGAGGNAQHGISLLQAFADQYNLILLAPESRAGTWDVIRGGYGPDVSYIDKALEQTFSRYTIDPTHLAVGGFSDGASYALSIGLINGNLFTHILSFSPGFMAPTKQEGKPRIYNSHGIHDQVLPIDRCSRHLVPELQRSGYDVLYREFDGPHTVPHEIATEAVEWFTK